MWKPHNADAPSEHPSLMHPRAQGQSTITLLTGGGMHRKEQRWLFQLTLHPEMKTGPGGSFIPQLSACSVPWAWMGPVISFPRQPSNMAWGKKRSWGLYPRSRLHAFTLFWRLKKCSPIDESQIKPFMRIPQALLSLLPA